MKTYGALAALVVCMLLVACGDDDGSTESITVATVYNVSGPQAVLDVPSSNGSALAASQINARGGVLGRELSLVAVEGESDPSMLATETESTLDEEPDVVALLGLSDTDMVLSSAPVAATRGLVFLSSGATSPKLPDQVPGYLYIACFGDNVQAAAGAEWAYEALGARTAFVLYDPTETYTDLLQGYFIDRFTELGGTVTASHQIDPRSGDLEVVPAPGDVDLVFLGVETAEDAGRVIPLLRDAGYSGPILGGDGYDAESVWAESPEISDVYFTTHVYLGADNPNPLVGAFIEAYAEAYPGETPSAFAALGYDAVGLVAAAIERADDASADGVARGLAGLEDYQGVTGTISFRDGSRIPTKGVTVLRVSGGRQEFVVEIVPEGVPSP